MADLCDKVGADVQDVARGIGLDNHIGSKFLHAGPGYGGSCFLKDTRALIRTAQEAARQCASSKASRMPTRRASTAEKVKAACGGSVAGKTIAVPGLGFKPNTDDMREAPSLTIIPTLQAMGAQVRAFDAEPMGQARPLLGGAQFGDDPYACADRADALVILTEWDAFRALDLVRVKGLLAEPVIIDMRNVYRLGDMRRRGFRYVGVGRN